MKAKLMNSSRVLVVTVLLIAILLILPMCVPSGHPSEQIPAPVERAPAKFQVGHISITPETIMADDKATITANITNTGESAGIYMAVLDIDGKEVDRTDVHLSAGQSREVSFLVPTGVADNYGISIGDSSSTMEVCNWGPYIIKYDDELAERLPIYVPENFGHLVYFTPPTVPFKVQKIMVNGYKGCNQVDGCPRTCDLRLWNQDSSQKLWEGTVPWSLFGSGGWHEIDVPDVRVEGDFYVELVTHSTRVFQDAQSGLRYASVSVNCGKCPEAQRSGVSLNGQLVSTDIFDMVPRCWAIRVEGQGAPL